MAELHPVHCYAAGALLALALHQAQIHQQFLPSDPWLSSSVVQEDSPSAVEGDGEDHSLWTSYHCGLLRPVFRYLKIDSKAWPGLEQTAVSSNAKDHIAAFLRMLSEEEEEGGSMPSLRSNSEVDLAKAVSAVTLSLKESSMSVATVQRNDSREISKTCEKTTNCSQDESDGKLLCQDAEQHSILSKSNAQEASELPIPTAIESQNDSCQSKNSIKDTENASPLCPSDKSYVTSYDHRLDASSRPRSIPEMSKKQELRGLQKAAVDGASVGESSDNHVINDNKIVESNFLTQQRKVAVLYELLAAYVADTPTEKGDKSKLRRGYDARQRVALRLLATWLDVKWEKVAAMEIMVAYSAMAAQEERDANPDEDENRKKSWARWKRGGLIGAAALTGGTLLALTGGLAAPAIAAGLSAIAPTLGTIVPGFAAAAAAAGTTAGSVAVAASFGAAGAGLTGSKMYRRTGGVDEFGFESLGENHQQGRLGVGIVVSGFINDTDDFTKPWRGHDYDLEMYALCWETKNLIALSSAIQDWLTSSISRELMRQGAMLTILSTLVAAIALPSALLSLTNFIDSKWTLAVDRSDKAGVLLAEVLLKGLQGNRPVTLIGFSLGARVIFKCLEELAKKEENGGIIERVVLLGSPLPVETQQWETVRKVVAGRFVNAYSTNDWLLGVVYRASLLTQGLAGIQAVDAPGIENIDVTDVINSHSSYLSEVSEILKAIDIDSYYPIFPSKISVNES